MAGMVIGGLAAAGTMLLLAPQPGQKTRADLRQKGLELREQTAKSLGTRIAEVRAKAREAMTPARKQIQELQQRGQQVLEEQRGRIPAPIAQFPTG